jgi:hypothetical protein
MRRAIDLGRPCGVRNDTGLGISRQNRILSVAYARVQIHLHA